MSKAEKFLTEVKARYEVNELGAFKHSALFIHAHAGGDVNRLVAMVELYEREMQRILNKVNAVTALWLYRHGQRIGHNAMNELSNRQIEVEEALADLDRIAAGGEVRSEG